MSVCERNRDQPAIRIIRRPAAAVVKTGHGIGDRAVNVAVTAFRDQHAKPGGYDYIVREQRAILKTDRSL